MAFSDKVKEYFAPKAGVVRLRDIVREVPGAIEDVGKEIVQGTARSVAALGISSGNAPTNISNKLREKLGKEKVDLPFQTRIRTSDNPITSAVFGGKDIKSLTEYGKGGIDFVEDVTGKKINPAVAPFLGFGGAAVDVFPSGKVIKEDLKLTEQAIKEILNTKNVAKIRELIMGTGQILEKDADNIARALRDVDNMDDFNKVSSTLKERGFVRSVKDVAPKATKVSGQYIPRSTDELSLKASNLIKDDIATAERVAREGTDENAVAIASELIKKYSDDAAKAGTKGEADLLYDKVADIANTIAPKLTELGRAVQAASILGRMTPEGQIRFAAKTIENFNQANPAKRIPGLTGAQVERFSKEAKEIFEMPDGIERAQRYQKFQQEISDLVPTPLMKKLTTIWKAGLLTGIKTSGLNIFSNIAHFTAETVKDIPAAAVDSVASLFTGERTTTATLRGTGKGLKEGFEKGFRYLKTGFDERNIGDKLEYKRINFGKGPVAKLAKAYTESVFRVIGAQDQPFYYGTLARSLHDQALATAKNMGLSGKEAVKYAEEIVDNPTEEMITAATLDAMTAVFQNKTVIGELGEALRRTTSTPGVKALIGDKAEGALEVLMPFVRTPAAVAMQILNYSPVGAVRAIVGSIGKGNFNQRQFSKLMGRSITGTVPLYIGYKLMENDQVSLAFPETERERALWEAEGRKDNTIKIDGKWQEPTVLGPMGNLVLLGAYYKEGLDKAASPAFGMYEALKTAAAGGFNALKEQTFLTGINSFVNAFDDPTRYGESYVAGLAASLIPTIVSDVAKATDPLERRTEDIPERVQSRIPGARTKLEPKVDILGREIESKGNPLEIMIDPRRPQKDTSTPVIKEIRRLQEAGLTVAPTKLGSSKEGYSSLTPEQNTEMWIRSGELLNQKLTALTKHPGYLSADDADRAKAIKSFTEQVQVLVRAEMVLEMTQGMNQQQLLAKLGQLKQDREFLNQDVYRKFLEIR